MANWLDLEVEGDFNQILQKAAHELIFVIYYAEWAPNSKSIVSYFKGLCFQYPQVLFLAVNTDNFESLLESAGIESVPAILVKRSSAESVKIVYPVTENDAKSYLLQALDLKKPADQCVNEICPQPKAGIIPRPSGAAAGGCGSDSCAPSSDQKEEKETVVSSANDVHSHSHPEPHAHSEPHSHLNPDEEKPQWSVVFSDGVLASVCLRQGSHLLNHQVYWPAMGISIIGIAATFGTFRFGILPQIKPVHSFFSAAGAAVSFPLIGLGYWYRNPSTDLGLFLPPILIVSGFLLRRKFPFPQYDTIAAGLGVLGILAYGLTHSNWSAFLGALAVIIATAVEETTKGDKLFGILKKVDFFHYVLAIGIGFLSKSFQ